MLSKVDFNTLGEVDQDILIYNNPAMTTMPGFGALTLANRHIEIHDNDALTF